MPIDHQSAVESAFLSLKVALTYRPDLSFLSLDDFMYMGRTEYALSFKHCDTRDYLYVCLRDRVRTFEHPIISVPQSGGHFHRGEFLMDPEECGCCGGYHPRGYQGDCRDDSNRYPDPYGPSCKTMREHPSLDTPPTAG